MSTQIMQSVQENELFSEISAEEAATVSGGGPVAGALSNIAAVSGGGITWRNPTVQAGIFANAFNITLQ